MFASCHQYRSRVVAQASSIHKFPDIGEQTLQANIRSLHLGEEPFGSVFLSGLESGLSDAVGVDKCPALARRSLRVAGSNSVYTMVTKRPHGKSSTIMLLRRVRTSPGPEPVCASDRNMPRVADINSAAAVPLPETSASTNPQRPSESGM